MFKFFRRLSYDRFQRVLAIITIIFLTSGILLFWINSSLVEQAAVTATQQKMLVLARAGAKSVESMLSMFEAELLMLADKEEFVNSDLDKARIDMGQIVSLTNLPIMTQLGLISKDGLLLILADNGEIKLNEGFSLADRIDFQWAKTAKKGKVFISPPTKDRIGANANKWVFHLATPIIKDKGSFGGVLYFSIRLEDLTTNYVEALKLLPTTAVYVINKDGLIISSSPFESLVGINAREYAQEKKWNEYQTYLDNIGAMTQGKEGTRVYWFRDTNARVEKWIGGFSPTKVGENLIIVAVATPYKEAYSVVNNFIKNQVIWLVFLVMAGIATAFFFITGVHLSKKEGYDEGLKDGAAFERNNRTKKNS